MSQPALRPWLAAARCSSRKCSLGANIIARHQSTHREALLETPEDWANFRKTREERKLQFSFFEPYGSTTTSTNTFKYRDGLVKPPRDATVSALLAAGAHFGHAASRMNPNFVPYAYGTRAGITIIDLDHTLPMLRQAASLVRAIARAGGLVVFIGTRPDLRPIVTKAAERLGRQGFYVGERWLPGTLSNRRQFFGDHVVDKERMLPDLAIILNPLQNTIAINEFAAENIPTIGIIDTNVDPRLVMYPIPANDENTRTAELIGGVLSIAGREGVALFERDNVATLKQQGKKQRQRISSSMSNE
ncbi:37S ribosomal protein mrp4, mitochondrial [Psilocybe cubensis]|uniref:Ribosomal protein S2 n=2 Tax=Psilocybe cubensis TaxID=181762 RepID=A0A8H7Y276_PSICU|nr:37S ribosomal protein mrp4, mitochondrial [Psilocybe cubensis]KAH9484045.1 37S ribosomal protein mrp4, mitochondrial [Psilocybe cubensis]